MGIPYHRLCRSAPKTWISCSFLPGGDVEQSESSHHTTRSRAVHAWAFEQNYDEVLILMPQMCRILFTSSTRILPVEHRMRSNLMRLNQREHVGKIPNLDHLKTTSNFIQNISDGIRVPRHWERSRLKPRHRQAHAKVPMNTEFWAPHSSRSSGASMLLLIISYVVSSIYNFDMCIFKLILNFDEQN